MEKDKIMLEDYYQLDNSYYHKRLDDDYMLPNGVWLLSFWT